MSQEISSAVFNRKYFETSAVESNFFFFFIKDINFVGYI